MRKKLVLTLIVALIILIIPVYSSLLAGSNITITGPTGATEVIEGHDFASEVRMDPWDMSNREDMSHRVIRFKTIQWTGGNWRATTNSSDSYFWFMWGGDPGSYMTLRDGGRTKVNTGRYKRLTFKMYLSGSEGSYLGRGQFYWFYRRDLKYPKVKTFNVYAGWHTYQIDLPGSWSGWPISLRMDPVPRSNRVVKIDYIRLTDRPGNKVNLTWDDIEGGPATVYVDKNNSGYDGSALTTVNSSVGANSANIDVDGLEPGNYYFYMKKAGGTYSNYSIAGQNINKAPLVKITDPDEKGGADWATRAMRNSWNMSSSGDLFKTFNTYKKSFSRGRYTGVNYAANRKNDPYFMLNLRRKTINPKIFHRLTVRYAYSGGFSLRRGTMSRIGWLTRRYNDPKYWQISDDIVTYAGWNTYTIDLKKIKLNRGSYGWKNRITQLRFDPHEDRYTRRFYVDYIVLRADDAMNSNGSFVVRYKLYDTNDSSVNISFYRDRDKSFGNGNEVFIRSLVAAPGSRSFTWKPSKHVNGTYYIYAKANDGVDQRGYYSTGPVKIAHNLSINSSHKRIRRGGVITLTGRVIPKRTTTLYIKHKRNNGKWYVAKRISLTGSSYKTRIRLRKPGKYIFMGRVPKLSSRKMAVYVL